MHNLSRLFNNPWKASYELGIAQYTVTTTAPVPTFQSIAELIVHDLQTTTHDLLKDRPYGRRLALTKALAAYGLQSDSHTCAHYIARGYGPNNEDLAGVVEVVREMN